MWSPPSALITFVQAADSRIALAHVTPSRSAKNQVFLSKSATSAIFTGRWVRFYAQLAALRKLMEQDAEVLAYDRSRAKSKG